MQKNNPSRRARALVLAGTHPRSSLHRILPRERAQWRLIRSGPLELPDCSRASCGGYSAMETSPASNTMNSPMGSASATTGRPGRDATPSTAN